MGSITKFCDAMRWAADSDKPGYSQSDRYSLTPDKFFTDVLTNTDCSALTIAALQYAGFDTGWASYTGNMSDALCANGWLRLPNDGNPQRGDILLNDADHVAVWLGDCLAQASIGEGGLVSGGARGDQTGWEVNTRDYYNYPWNCYLRWPYEDDESEDEMGIYDVHESAAKEIGGSDGSMIDHVDYLEARVKDLYEPHESAAGDGTVGSMKNRIDFIDKRVREGEQKLDAIGKQLKNIETMLKKAVK